MIIESFSKALRELRTANKITQEKLAEMCDLDRTYISLIERGKGNQHSKRSSIY